jgi:hypothetical protein
MLSQISITIKNTWSYQLTKWSFILVHGCRGASPRISWPCSFGPVVEQSWSPYSQSRNREKRQGFTNLFKGVPQWPEDHLLEPLLNFLPPSDSAKQNKLFTWSLGGHSRSKQLHYLWDWLFPWQKHYLEVW